MTLIERRPKIAEVAARAGVSTSTVDRVMNDRGGVHQKTVVMVERAIREIMGREIMGREIIGREIGADDVAGGEIMLADVRNGRAARSALRFDAVLAGDGSEVTKGLGQAMAAAAARRDVRLETAFVERMNPQALADHLRGCAEQGSDGIAVQALDHGLVREAMRQLADAGIPMVTVLTDMAGVDRLAYVGLDNRAAGRTAGLLMGRFCRTAGKLAILWGGQLYRSHEERESGFRGMLRTERADLQCLEVITGNDDPAVARARAREVIARHPDLVGIYCVGGGVTGVADAVEDAGVAQSLVMIAHNCNSQTKPYLVAGTIDALIHQDISQIAETAVAALCDPNAPAHGGVPVEIITRENLM